MKNWRNWLRIIATGFLVLMGIFIFNQFMQLYRNLSMIHPILGLTVIIILLALLAYYSYKLVQEFIKLPKEIDLADGASPEDYEAYVITCLDRLKNNPSLQAWDFDWESIQDQEAIEQVQAAHQVLREHSIDLIKTQAETVFLSTAISQNGSLDAMTVLVVLTKMVWQLIKTYDTRPSLAKIVAIYTNVATTILMARGLEDLDLIEAQIEPLISSILGGSLLSMIPGSVSVTNLIANSILEGSINSLLTLRVGIVTIDYLASVKDTDSSKVKRSASLEATKLLGSIIKDGSVKVIQVMVRSIKNAGIQTGKKFLPFS